LKDLKGLDGFRGIKRLKNDSEGLKDLWIRWL